MDQVLIQLVMDAQGEVSLEYLADLVRRLPPEKIVELLAHLAAELDKDAQELQAGLTAGKLPPWVGEGGGTNSPQKPQEPDLAEKDDEATWE